MNQKSWEELQQELAARLLRLTDGDTVILSSGGRYTQLQQGPNWIRLEAASNHSLSPAEQLSAEQQERLLGMGWQPPAPPLDDNWWVQQEWPLSGRTATRLADMIVVTLRNVYGTDEVSQVEEKTFNAFA